MFVYVTENFHHEHFIDPTNRPWVSEEWPPKRLTRFMVHPTPCVSHYAREIEFRNQGNFCLWNPEYSWVQGIRNPKNDSNCDPKFPRASRLPCLFLLLSCNIYVIRFYRISQKSPKFGLFSQGISTNQERGIFFSLWMTMLIIFLVLQLSSRQHASSVLKLRTSAYFVRIPSVRCLVHLKIDATQLRDTQRFSSDPIHLLLQP